MNSHFNATRLTKVIVHGFLEDNILMKPDWMFEMAKQLLLNDDFNVLIVNWSGGNKLPFTQATANTRVVGAEIALMIRFLQNEAGLRPTSVHIIGHSLGAHVAGYTGKIIPNLGRITGLDPAEPYFQNMPVQVRLDRSDAQFVDVIHSDAHSVYTRLGFGMSQKIGHVDFFPNGGYHQPGCLSERFVTFITKGLYAGLRKFVSCFHTRAIEYFISSINGDSCQLVGYSCPDYDFFNKYRCSSCGKNGEGCLPMGLKADQGPLRSKIRQNESLTFYLNTDRKESYCLKYYHIRLDLDQADTSIEDIKGKLQLTIYGTRGAHPTDITDAMHFYHGSSVMMFVTTSDDVGEIKEIGFHWTSEKFALKNLLNPLKWFANPVLHLNKLTIKPMHKLNDQSQKSFCVANAIKGIPAGSEAILKTVCD